MGELKGKQLASKWVKTAALLSNPDVANHIPETKRFNGENLKSMLKAHGMVVIKPIVGAGGHGVIKVTSESKNYSYMYYSKIVHTQSFSALVASLNKLRKGRAYLIQKGIQLATVDGRPIDYRVKYVKDGESWEYRAIVGRIARPGLFVTNLCRGGTMVKGKQGLSRSFSPEHASKLKKEMRRLTVDATRTLEEKIPGVRQLGFDYGIDKQGNIWILEVNTRPQ